MTVEEMVTITNMGRGAVNGGYSDMGRCTDMSSYEHFAMAEKASRRPSGTAIGGIVLGGVALAGVIGAWVFAGTYANAKSRGNERAIDILATQALHERNERVTCQNQMNPGIMDVIRITNYAQSGAGAGAGAGASSMSTAEALAAIIGGGNGRSGQVCPQPVALYQPAMPCACPGSCNG